MNIANITDNLVGEYLKNLALATNSLFYRKMTKKNGVYIVNIVFKLTKCNLQ